MEKGLKKKRAAAQQQPSPRDPLPPLCVAKRSHGPIPSLAGTHLPRVPLSFLSLSPTGGPHLATSSSSSKSANPSSRRTPRTRHGLLPNYGDCLPDSLYLRAHKNPLSPLLLSPQVSPPLSRQAAHTKPYRSATAAGDVVKFR